MWEGKIWTVAVIGCGIGRSHIAEGYRRQPVKFRVLRFVANDDATGRQQLLNHTQPEREPEIQPDGVADDLAGEPITGIAGTGRCHHPTRLPTPVRFRKRGAAKLTVPAASLYKSSDDIRLCPAARAPVSRKC